LELDVHLIRDGEVVVIHDDTVDATTDGNGAVRNMSLSEIKRLDAGYSYTPDGKRHPDRGEGIEVPTLGEVLSKFPDTPVNIDIKEEQEGVEKAVWRVIRKNDAEDRVLVGSFHGPVVKRFRDVSEGKVATAATKREARTFYALSRIHMEGLINPPYEALQVPPSYGDTVVVTPRLVQAAHNRGVRVDVWTVNEASRMNQFLDMGVDTIITDRPGVLDRVLEERDKE
jgi:glycerophosphoryl diester phosphodiesterase